MISAVILNWERPYKLKHIILPILAQCPQIDEIIISYGKLDTAFDYESERCRMVHRRDYGDIDRRYGMARRFLAYEDATNEVILSLDDDIHQKTGALPDVRTRTRKVPKLVRRMRRPRDRNRQHHRTPPQPSQPAPQYVAEEQPQYPTSTNMSQIRVGLV